MKLSRLLQNLHLFGLIAVCLHTTVYGVIKINEHIQDTLNNRAKGSIALTLNLINDNLKSRSLVSEGLEQKAMNQALLAHTQRIIKDVFPKANVAAEKLRNLLINFSIAKFRKLDENMQGFFIQVVKKLAALPEPAPQILDILNNTASEPVEYVQEILA